MNVQFLQNHSLTCAKAKSLSDNLFSTIKNKVIIEENIAVFGNLEKRFYALTLLKDGIYEEEKLSLLIADGIQEYNFGFIPAVGQYIIELK